MWKKRLADGLTVTRLLLALGIVWVGFHQGAAGFPVAVVLLLAAWITDVLDGPLARSSGVERQTWIGAHDLHVDLAVGMAVLAYMRIAGFVDARLAVVYLLAWTITFWRLGSFPKPFGALFQGPIYVWFACIALREAPAVGLWLVLYVVVTVGFTWKRFTHRLLPEFFRGLGENLRVRSHAER